MERMMQRATRTAGRRVGFTLIEGMIAIMVMAIVMGGVYALVVQAAQMSRKARDHYVAVNICKNRIERAKNFQYSDLRFLAESVIVVDENGNPTTSGNFRRTTVVNTNYGGGLTQVTVTCQLRNYRTGTWGSSEVIASLYTQY
jgi:prepilin-type N-terminal cleavage/methylation domain-containing protein